MPVGFELRNQYGNYLIDSTYKNFQLRERFGVGANQTVTREFWQIANPVPAAEFSDYGAIESANTNNKWTWYAEGSAGNMFLFDTDAPPPSNNNAGFEIYNEQGVKCFHSALANFKVVDFVTIDTLVRDTDRVFSYVTGRRYAVVPVSPSFYTVFFQPQQFWQIFQCRYKSLNGAVVFRTFQIGIENDPAVYSTDGPVIRYARYLILDVTNM